MNGKLDSWNKGCIVDLFEHWNLDAAPRRLRLNVNFRNCS
jgi:hypothetical protein